ncbi:MAG: zinc ribbon domain-containing protein [Candidatus Marinimicrobia bacterium]|nr:zinc ribbon domain-containing protein [Candidatus Neomarinimicrobiota bacterium]
MPMYDYRCNNCGKEYEELVWSSSTPDEKIKCPECGEQKSQRLLSAPAISTGSTSSSGGCSPSSGFS